MIQERLDEFIFHRTYLRDQPFNVFVMLRLLAKYGKKAQKFVEVDEKKCKDDKERIYYRCEEIQEDENEEKEEKDVDGDTRI